MTSVAGFTPFNEAAATVGDISLHLYGSRRALQAVGLAGAVCLYGAIRTFWPFIPFWRLSEFLPSLWNGKSWVDAVARAALTILSDAPLVALVAVCVSVVLWTRMESRFAIRFVSRLAQQADGLEPRPTRVTIAAAALTYQDGGVTTTAEWPSVVDLFASNGYWIFLLIAQPIVLPKRFFADGTAEHAFIAEALSYMSDESRARSRGAVKFAAKDIA